MNQHKPQLLLYLGIVIYLMAAWKAIGYGCQLAIGALHR